MKRCTLLLLLTGVAAAAQTVTAPPKPDLHLFEGQNLQKFDWKQSPLTLLPPQFLTKGNEFTAQLAPGDAEQACSIPLAEAKPLPTANDKGMIHGLQNLPQSDLMPVFKGLPVCGSLKNSPALLTGRNR